MRTLILMIGVSLVLTAGKAMAQGTWSTTGNSGTAPGTHYIGTTDGKDFVFKTQNIERGRILNSNGAWRFGTSANYARIDAAGKLIFSGAGGYQVGANKYVFQYSSSPNIGLYYSASSSAHQFRDNNGGVVASVGSLTGNGYFKGNVGIGNATPVYKLDVAGTGRFTGALTLGSYTLPATDGVAGQVLTTNGGGGVSWTTVSGGSSTNPWLTNGSNIYYSIGNIGIGTSDLASGYKLSVLGKIMCEEIKVQLASNWPDYVFNEGYRLMPLEELATKIAANKHLPGIPTAKEIQEQGLGLGEMQTKMMEKIEELTLYLISANNEMTTANERIVQLKQQVELLQERIQQLERN